MWAGIVPDYSEKFFGASREKKKEMILFYFLIETNDFIPEGVHEEYVGTLTSKIHPSISLYNNYCLCTFLNLPCTLITFWFWGQAAYSNWRLTNEDEDGGLRNGHYFEE